MRILILAVLLAFLSPASPHARTWYVLSDGTGDAPTLQAAIDSSSAGDTVLVGSGTYPYAIIEERDSLTVLSESGPSVTVISGMFMNFATYVTVSGFSFEIGHAGLSINWSHDLLIENNIVHNVTNGGIGAFVVSRTIIRNNLIYQCGEGGIGIFDAAGNIEVRNNTVWDCSYVGISTDAYPIIIANNIVSQNDVGISAVNPVFLECNDVYGNGTNYDLWGASDPTGMNGNISADPQFCAASPENSGNFHIQSDSPCAPGNHPNGYSCGLIGREPVNCGSTAVEHTTWGAVKSMFK